jgi:hypothetical protein
MLVSKFIIKSKLINSITIDNNEEFVNICGDYVEDSYIIKFYIQYKSYSQQIKIKYFYDSIEYIDYICFDNYKHKFTYNLIQSNNEYKDFYIEEC